MKKILPTNWYPGTTKADMDQGYEKLDSDSDNQVFGASCRSPRANGWKDAPPEEHLVIDFGD